MELERVQVDHVNVSARLRAVDGGKIKQLADSMDAIGLQSPITIFFAGEDADGFELVAGAHRLAAAKSLGWEWIDAVFMQSDELDRQIWEIDENLMRSELTPTQMAEHLAKRKELWTARQESGQTLATLTGRGNKQFATDTAEKTGAAKSTINLAVSRADRVCQEARDVIRGTKLDTGVFLDRLKSVPEGQQEQFARHHLERIERPPSKPTIAQEPDDDQTVTERQVAALMAAWNKAGKEAREEFMGRIESPIMEGWGAK